MIASTNHLDQLDPGLSSRPSRFDRKYLFPLPSTHERALYAEFWRNKISKIHSIKFPKKLCGAIADITADFSFAYLQEAFVATLLAIARRRSEGFNLRNAHFETGDEDDDDEDLDEYELWREMKKQVKLLRDDMGSQPQPKPVVYPETVEQDLSWKTNVEVEPVTRWHQNSAELKKYGEVPRPTSCAIKLNGTLLAGDAYRPVLRTLDANGVPIHDRYSVRTVSGHTSTYGLVPMDADHRGRMMANKEFLADGMAAISI